MTYKDEIVAALDQRQIPRAPRTMAELTEALDRFPGLRHLFLPAADICAAIKLPRHLVRPQAPFGELFQERFLATLEDVPAFNTATNAALVAGGGE